MIKYIAIALLIALAMPAQGQNVIGKSRTLGRIDGRGNSLPESLHSAAVLWMEFEYNDTTNYYNYGNFLNDGFVTNVSCNPSVGGGYATFDGINDNIRVIKKAGLTSFNTNDFSVMAMYRTSWTGTTWIVDTYGTGGGQIILSSPSLSFGTYSDAVGSTLAARSPTPIANGGWFYFVGTRAGTTMQAYTNGILCWTTNGTLRNVTNSNPLTIGGRWDAGAANRFYNGDLALFAIFNRLITSNEQSQVFNSIRGRLGL